MPPKMVVVREGKCRCGQPCPTYRVEWTDSTLTTIEWTPCPRCDGPLFR